MTNYLKEKGNVLYKDNMIIKELNGKELLCNDFNTDLLEVIINLLSL